MTTNYNYGYKLNHAFNTLTKDFGHWTNSALHFATFPIRFVLDFISHDSVEAEIKQNEKLEKLRQAEIKQNLTQNYFQKTEQEYFKWIDQNKARVVDYYDSRDPKKVLAGKKGGSKKNHN